MTPETIYNNAINMRDRAIDNRWKIMGLFFFVQAGGFSLLSVLLKEVPILLVAASVLYGLTLTPYWVNLVGRNEVAIVFLTTRISAVEITEAQAIPLFGQEFTETLLIGLRTRTVLFNLILIFSFVWFVVANAVLLRVVITK